MIIKYGEGTTQFGPGVSINLEGEEVAVAIEAYLVAHDVRIRGPRTITVNGELCKNGHVYVDPSGFVVSGSSESCSKFSGRGKISRVSRIDIDLATRGGQSNER